MIDAERLKVAARADVEGNCNHGLIREELQAMADENGLSLRQQQQFAVEMFVAHEAIIGAWLLEPKCEKYLIRRGVMSLSDEGDGVTMISGRYFVNTR